MTSRWLPASAALALVASIAIQESQPGETQNPPPDEQAAPEPGAPPDGAPDPNGDAPAPDAQPMQRFQMDPNFNSIEVAPPPPLNAPSDGAITPPPQTPAQDPQTRAPPPAPGQGPPQQ